MRLVETRKITFSLSLQLTIENDPGSRASGFVNLRNFDRKTEGRRIYRANLIKKGRDTQG